MAKKIDRKLNGEDIVEKEFGDFLENGGEIGNEIIFPNNALKNNIVTPLTIGGNTMYYRENVTNNAGFSHICRFEDDTKGSKLNQNGIELKKTYGDTSTFFRPLVDGTVDLGGASYKWKDLWLGSYNKASNGYTKLPNGLIIQWGTVTLPASVGSNTFSLPLTFPTTNLSAQVTVLDQSNVSSSSACRLLNFTPTSIIIANSISVSLKATFFCIGY